MPYVINNHMNQLYIYMRAVSFKYNCYIKKKKVRCSVFGVRRKLNECCLRDKFAVLYIVQCTMAADVFTT